jgi:phosphoglycolate phosphatase
LYKAFLFDFDGTFADTAPDLIASANYIYTKYKKPAISFEQGRAIASDGTRAFLNLRFDKKQNNLDIIALEFLDYYRKNLLQKTVLFDGISSLVALFIKEKIKWGVVTNKPREFTEKILSHYGLLNEINVLLCGDDGYPTKPAPDMLLKACHTLAIDPADIAYIGDAKRDIVAANSAKMISILACYGYLKKEDNIDSWGAQRIILSPNELSALILNERNKYKKVKNL